MLRLFGKSPYYNIITDLCTGPVDRFEACYIDSEKSLTKDEVVSILE